MSDVTAAGHQTPHRGRIQRFSDWTTQHTPKRPLGLITTFLVGLVVAAAGIAIFAAKSAGPTAEKADPLGNSAIDVIGSLVTLIGLFLVWVCIASVEEMVEQKKDYRGETKHKVGMALLVCVSIVPALLLFASFASTIVTSVTFAWEVAQALLP
jgi:Na+/melibiose symporter-like transporter